MGLVLFCGSKIVKLWTNTNEKSRRIYLGLEPCQKAVDHKQDLDNWAELGIGHEFLVLTAQMLFIMMLSMQPIFRY